VSNISVDYDVLNQRGSPAWFTDTFANIPTAGFVGRMFISKDTFAFYRDTGSGWDLIGGPGTGTLTGSGVSGQVSFFNGTQTITGNNNLFWDNTNGRLGIGTITPGASLDIHSTGTNAQFNGTGTNNAYLVFQNAGTSKWRIGNTYNAGANSFDIYIPSTNTTPLSISSIGTITLTANVNTTGQQYVGNGLYITYVNGGSFAGYTNIWGRTDGLNFALGNTTGGASFIFQTAAIYDYTFPASTGTIALLQSAQTFSGLNSFSLSISAVGGVAFPSTIGGSNYGGILGTANFFQISAQNGSSILMLSSNGTSAITINTTGNVNFGSTIGNGTYTYTLPSATGTLALTSDITSAINGTTNNLAKFTSSNVIGNSGVSDDGTNLTYTSTAKATLLVKAANNTFYGQLAFTNGSNASYGGISYNNSGQYMQFETNTSEWMRLGSDGKLLIGKTASTGGVLQVSNGTNMFNVDYDGNGPYITAVNNANTIYKRLTIDASEILFDISASERMRITSAGNVGIGTVSPSYKLDIMGNTSNSVDVTMLRLWNNTGENCGSINFDNVFGPLAQITGTKSGGGSAADDGIITFSTASNSVLSTKMGISSTGIVTINNLGSGTVTATSGQLSAVSDMNLKIEDGFIDNALEKVLNLKPRYFLWKKETGLPTNLRQLGFYAQEVNQAIGEEGANTPKNENEKWGIYDRAIIAMLTKAVQELNEKLIKNNIN